jgi:hypothetical protein
MAIIDPEQERQRLAEFYSHQLDGELEAVAEQAYELTDLARQALRAEMSRRGLSAALIEVPPAVPVPAALPGDPPKDEPPERVEASTQDGELELRKMLTIRQFRDLPEALLAKGSLESAGIEAVLTDDNIVRLDWFWSNLMGGVKLKVSPEDVGAANEILDQPIPEGFDVAGIGEYQQPHCPSCQSLDVNFQEVTPAAFVSAYLNVPIPFHRRAWRCHDCDAEWEDDGVPGTSESSTSDSSA